MVRLLTPNQAAEATGLGLVKILRLCKAGAFGRNISTGRRPTWRIREDELMEYFRAPSAEKSKKGARTSRIDGDVEMLF